MKNFDELVEKSMSSPEAVAKGAELSQPEEYLKYSCVDPGCIELVASGEKYCSRHKEEHAEDGEPRPRREFSGNRRKVGTRGGRRGNKATPEERVERERKQQERRVRQLAVSGQGPKGTAGGGSGGKPQANPNSKKGKRRARKEAQKNKKKK